MIGKKAMTKLQRRLLRSAGMTRHTDPEKAGLSIHDYDSLCQAHAAKKELQAVYGRNSRTLILK